MNRVEFLAARLRTPRPHMDKRYGRLLAEWDVAHVSASQMAEYAVDQIEEFDAAQSHEQKYADDVAYRRMCNRVAELSLALTRIEAETMNRHISRIARDALRPSEPVDQACSVCGNPSGACEVPGACL